MDRRDFVTATTTAALAATFRIPQSAFRNRLSRIGVQLYTVRDLMQKDVEGTLAAIAKIGYQEVEFAGFFNRTPADIRAILERNGLAAPSGHVPFEAIDQGWDQVLDAAHTLGHRYVVVAWIDEKYRKDLDGWKRVADTLNRAGAACSKSNLTLAFHNHSYEFVPLPGGQLPYDVLLAATDAGVVKLEMDLFWITYGGQDPLAYFAKYPGRVPLVHVKDMAPKPRPDTLPDSVMRSVGQGTIDWKKIFARAEQAGIKHYFVEHDSPGDALGSITASYTYLKALEF
jgi:sugar phosphate isomerase/epimerase